MEDDRLLSRPVSATRKLSIPHCGTHLVSRPHLTAQLDQSLQHRLTFVHAPAGYGKTTLLAQWLAKRKKRACWLSLDQADNDLPRFYHYLAAALKSSDPSGDERLSWLPAAADLQSDTLWEMIAGCTGGCQDGLVIVLDNYQVIEGSQIDDFLAVLLENTATRLHLVICSRAPLPLALTRICLTGGVTELTTDNLRFNADEIMVLYRSRNKSLTRGEAIALEQASEGWIVGLYIGVLTHNDAAPEGRSLSADNPYVADYLDREVLAKLPRRVQDFLLQTAILDGLTAPLCDAVVRSEGSRETLAALSGNGGFIIALDDQGQWYRHHRLFGDFLRRKLEQSSAAVLPILHRRAAEWFAACGCLDEAVDHALESRDYALVAEWIVEYAKTALASGRIQKLAIWLDALPQAVIDNNPLLGLACTWILLLTGRFEQYHAQLQKMASADFVDTSEQLAGKIRNELLLIQAAAASFVCDIDTCLDLNQEAHGRGSIFMSQGIEFLSAEASLLSCRVKVPLKKVLEFVLRMRSLWPGLGEPSGVWSLTLGELLYEQDQLDHALGVLTEGIGLAERANAMGPFLAGSITLARIARAKGKLDWAASIVTQAEHKLRQCQDYERLQLLDAFRIWLQADGEDVRGIAAWLTKVNNTSREDGKQRLEYEELARARALQALGRFEESARLLQQCLIAARAENRVPSLVVIQILQAIALEKSGDPEGAYFSLRDAFLIARRDGYLRSLIDEGAPLAALLRRYISDFTQKDPAFAEYVKTVWRLTSRHAAQLKRTAGLTPWAVTDAAKLTQRETEILHLLETGQTNLEIAVRTGISVNTVKRHVRNLYRKLRARNRVQAISRGQELQLL